MFHSYIFYSWFMRYYYVARLLGICGRNFGQLATLETTPYSVKKTPVRRAILKWTHLLSADGENSSNRFYARAIHTFHKFLCVLCVSSTSWENMKFVTVVDDGLEKVF
jgi:hypothetical protein